MVVLWLAGEHGERKNRGDAEGAEFSRREKAAEFTTKWLMTQRTTQRFWTGVTPEG